MKRLNHYLMAHLIAVNSMRNNSSYVSWKRTNTKY